MSLLANQAARKSPRDSSAKSTFASFTCDGTGGGIYCGHWRLTTRVFLELVTYEYTIGSGLVALLSNSSPTKN